MQPRRPFSLGLVSIVTAACGDPGPARDSTPMPPAEGGRTAAQDPTGGSAQSAGGSGTSGGSASASGGSASASGGNASASGGAPGRGGSAGANGGTTSGGTLGTGGDRAPGGAGTGGAVASGGSPAGTGGRAAAPGLGDFVCPPPPYAASPVAGSATPERIASVPPGDSFIGDGELSIVEGPVWLGGNLYVSQINNGSPFPGRPGGSGGAGGGEPGTSSAPPPARILKITETGEVSIAFENAGTNGLAIDSSGQLAACNHKTGSITRFSLTGDAPVDIVSQYQATRFNAPNDLTFGADGTLYFTDPDYQAPSPAPQSALRAYRVSPGSATAVPLFEDRPQPNGITLSPERNTLYVSGSDGVYAYPVLPDGSVGAGVPFGPGIVPSSDGMGVDCAGNLYTTADQTVIVLTPAGSELARISVPGVQSVTNVAFGGPTHTTLYITALGTGGRSGLFKLTSAIPGMPY